MIPEASVKRIAATLGVDPAVVDRDHALGIVLSVLAPQAALAGWVFKGGTCLRKCYFGQYRFSEDLDFTVAGHLQGALMAGAFPEAMVECDEYPEVTLPDPADAHVVYAVIESAADVLVTENVRHFPTAVLGSVTDATVMTSDEFLLALLEREPVVMAGVVKTAAADMRHPPGTADERSETSSSGESGEIIATRSRPPGSARQQRGLDGCVRSRHEALVVAGLGRLDYGQQRWSKELIPDTRSVGRHRSAFRAGCQVLGQRGDNEVAEWRGAGVGSGNRCGRDRMQRSLAQRLAKQSLQFALHRSPPRTLQVPLQ